MVIGPYCFKLFVVFLQSPVFCLLSAYKQNLTNGFTLELHSAWRENFSFEHVAFWRCFRVAYFFFPPICPFACRTRNRINVLHFTFFGVSFLVASFRRTCWAKSVKMCLSLPISGVRPRMRSAATRRRRLNCRFASKNGFSPTTKVWAPIQSTPEKFPQHFQQTKFPKIYT